MEKVGCAGLVQPTFLLFKIWVLYAKDRSLHF